MFSDISTLDLGFLSWVVSVMIRTNPMPGLRSCMWFYVNVDQ